MSPRNPAWTVRHFAGLNVNGGTVYWVVAERGDLWAFKPGHISRFRRDDIDAWVDWQQRQRGGTSSAERQTKR